MWFSAYLSISIVEHVAPILNSLLMYDAGVSISHLSF
jgi:hypothetical protein